VEAGVEERPESEESAKAAGLRYVNDREPGISRIAAGKGFYYRHADARRVSEPEVLERIRSLVIPPAWTDVWICRDPRGHVQASGRDARGRKQYIYHPRFREVREGTKFHRMLLFGESLPAIRRRVDEDLQRPLLSRERILATLVTLLETTLIRVGNEEYARTNDSYGLTTLQNQHAAVDGTRIRLEFRAKSGKPCMLDIADRRIANVVRRCQDLPGQHLFGWKNGDGTVHDVGSSEVNDYLREISGHDFTAKDFRTWGATVLAFVALRECEDCDSPTQAKRNVAAAIKSVAQKLNNTATVTRKSYVHPAVIDTYLDEAARYLLRDCPDSGLARKLRGLGREERSVLAFLRARESSAGTPCRSPHKGEAKPRRNHRNGTDYQEDR
jgi:DNA topoisomerase I